MRPHPTPPPHTSAAQKRRATEFQCCKLTKNPLKWHWGWTIVMLQLYSVPSCVYRHALHWGVSPKAISWIKWICLLLYCTGLSPKCIAVIMIMLIFQWLCIAMMKTLKTPQLPWPHRSPSFVADNRNSCKCCAWARRMSSQTQGSGPRQWHSNTLATEHCY